MKKKLILSFLLTLLVALCLTFGACSLFGGNSDGDSGSGDGQIEEEDNQSKAELIKFAGAVPDDNNEVFWVIKSSSLGPVSEIVTVSNGASFKVYYDEACTDELIGSVLKGKDGALENGDNYFYIKVTSADTTTVKNYKVNLYRSFQVSVNYYDGTKLLKSELVDTGREFTVQYTPDIPGYTFHGWVDEEGNGFSSGIVWDEMNLYANKTVNSYKVKLDVNGGEPIEKTEFVIEYGTNFTLPVTERFGYNFDGWEGMYGTVTDSSGKSHGIWTLTEDVTLTAKWTSKSYRLTVLSDNPAAGSVTASGYRYYGDDTSVEAVPNDGYTFLGWYGEDDELLTMDARYEFKMGTEITLTAKWGLFRLSVLYEAGGTASNMYTVKFDLNGGTGVTPETQYVTGFTPLKYPTEVPAKTGTSRVAYLFRGWFTKPNAATGTSSYDFSAEVKSDMTLYAVWYEVALTDKTYIGDSSSFNLDGTNTGSHQFMYFCPKATGVYSLYCENEIEELGGGTIIVIRNLTSGSEIFRTTYTDDDSHFENISLTEGDVYCIELWRAGIQTGEYVVSISINNRNGLKPKEGGLSSGIPDLTPTAAGTVYRLMAEAKEGYEFDGWYDDTGELISTELIFEFTMPYKTIEITAKWRPKS